MRGIQLIFLSGLCVALANLCMRRSVEARGSTKGYLFIQLLLSALLLVLINPVRTQDYSCSYGIATFAIVTGLLLAGAMIFLGRALESGPSGLSVATISCSSVVPILVLVFLFGENFGFRYTIWNGMGSILVIIGIIWANWSGWEGSNRKQWLAFLLLSFFAHVGYLVLLHWRALFVNFSSHNGLGFSFTQKEAGTQWFTPIVFFSAALIVQVFYFLTEQRRAFFRSEILYGVWGSIAGGIGAFFMIWATEVSTPIEHAMLFPVYSVTTLIACNLWSKWLYKEEILWKAHAMCITGLLIGTIDWSAIGFS